MPRKTTIPSTLRGLRAWLKGSKQGRALRRELTEKASEEKTEAKCRACQNIRPYPKCLIVLRRLGTFPGVEVYTEPGTSVRLLELPEVRGDTPEIERLIEDMTGLKLPKNWRHMLNLPVKRIRSEVYRGIPLAEALRYVELGEAISEIHELQSAAEAAEGVSDV